jgi:hypothetical protein
LLGRNFYLDAKDSDHITEQWAGKSFQAIWRCRGACTNRTPG